MHACASLKNVGLLSRMLKFEIAPAVIDASMRFTSITSPYLIFLPGPKVLGSHKLIIFRRPLFGAYASNRIHGAQVGCGNLSFLSTLQRIFPSARLAGCDPTEAYIQQIHEQVDNPEDFLCGFAPAVMFPLASNSFDLVVCNSVFQYFPNQASIPNMTQLSQSSV